MRAGTMAGLMALLLWAGPLLAAEVLTEAQMKTLLEATRKKYDLPALGAAVVGPSGPLQLAVVGVRKRGTRNAITLQDSFHLASDSKAMTAWLIAGLVEERKLSYETTLEQGFPELAGTMHPRFRKVTLAQLLTHHAGLPVNPPRDWSNSTKAPLRQQRRQLLERLLSREPDYEPGTKFAYSNVGYTIAGALAERVTDTSWEELLRKRLFEPLKMTTAGFGAPSADKKDQPWPHRANGLPAHADEDNPPVMGPAGIVHCSLADWSKFVADELRGSRGEGGLLPPNCYKHLRSTPFSDNTYTQGGWDGDRKTEALVLQHDGTNTMNYSSAILLIDRGLAVLVATNQGGKKAQAGCARVRDELVKQLK